MANEMHDIIETVAGSQAKFAVLKLFKENPYIMDNRYGLSLWVGKPEEMLAPELEEMVDMGLLQRWGKDVGAIYAYTRNQDMRRALDEHWDEISRRASENRWRQNYAVRPGREEE